MFNFEHVKFFNNQLNKIIMYNFLFLNLFIVIIVLNYSNKVIYFFLMLNIYVVCCVNRFTPKPSWIKIKLHRPHTYFIEVLAKKNQSRFRVLGEAIYWCQRSGFRNKIISLKKSITEYTDWINNKNDRQKLQ